MSESTSVEEHAPGDGVDLERRWYVAKPAPYVARKRQDGVLVIAAELGVMAIECVQSAFGP